ncbi:hypothetical protein ABZ345_40825 [Lentzea sp. NPDC005914]|uniref:hypothetical protein n=1 Tax=Lentzea sp. NPDC005914 TaxID=3154572 RepID=UPI0033CEACF1
MPLLYPLGWPIGACLVLLAVFVLRRRSGALPAVGLGCVFWVLIWVAFLCVAPRWRTSVLVVCVPIVAYGLAGAISRLWSRRLDDR